MYEQTATVELKELHPGQIQVLSDSKRFNVLKIGRRWGKTTLAVNELIPQPMLDGFPVAYFAPTYKDLNEVWKEIKYTLHPVIQTKDEAVKQITLVTGGVLDCWSMEDPDSGRGRKYKRVVIDEAEKAKKFQEAWERTIRSTLLDYKGDAWILSTPKFGQTFFKEMFTYPKQYPEWAAFNLSTYNNPYLDPEEIESMRATSSELVFRCENLAEDVDLAYRPFAYAFSEAKHVGTCQYNPAQRLYLSFDFNVNPITAIAAQNYDDTWFILREFRMENSNIHALCDRIRATYPKALMLITGDASGAGRTAITDGVINYYTVIQQKLFVSDQQIHTPRVNPSHADSSVLFNSILQNYRVVYNGVDCPYLIQDLKYVEMGADNSIAKKEAEKQGRGHLLDCNRYLWDTFMADYLKGYL